MCLIFDDPPVRPRGRCCEALSGGPNGHTNDNFAANCPQNCCGKCNFPSTASSSPGGVPVALSTPDNTGNSGDVYPLGTGTTVPAEPRTNRPPGSNKAGPSDTGQTVATICGAIAAVLVVLAVAGAGVRHHSRRGDTSMLGLKQDAFRPGSERHAAATHTLLCAQCSARSQRVLTGACNPLSCAGISEGGARGKRAYPVDVSSVNPAFGVDDCAVATAFAGQMQQVVGIAELAKMTERTEMTELGGWQEGPGYLSHDLGRPLVAAGEVIAHHAQGLYKRPRTALVGDSPAQVIAQPGADAGGLFSFGPTSSAGFAAAPVGQQVHGAPMAMAHRPGPGVQMPVQWRRRRFETTLASAAPG